MIFLHSAILLGLAALAIPILIHLLNRRQARRVDWGAMRFLAASLAAQSRRLMLEDIALLALRCLVVALLVLAMARPFIPGAAYVPWALVLPAVLAAAICAGIAAGLGAQPRVRRNLLRAAGALLVAALAATLIERRLQGRRWPGGGEAKDVAIVVDGSTSMRLRVEGRTNFERATEEAQAIVARCRPGDALALILAGPVPRPVIRTPTADHRAVAAALASREFRPVGGAFGALDALNAAAASLAEGHNPVKQIVLITDGQSAGWDLAGEARWRFVADAFKAFPVPPQVICRLLPFPSLVRDAAVAELAVSRKVVGTDRPLRVDVRIANAGTVPVQPAAVELRVDGTTVGRESLIKELPVDAAETVRFDVRFETPGRHVLQAAIVSEDDLPADNTGTRVVEVLDKLPVLIVDGAPSERFFQGASSFVRTALTPRGEEAGDAEAAAHFLVEPTVVRVTDLPTLADWSPYRVIILANVARLPASVTARLADFVRSGGGLLIAPGQRAEPAFYRGWHLPSGQLLPPALLLERVARVAPPARLELKTLTHPALEVIARPEQSDAGAALIKTFWKLGADPRDSSVRVGGLLDNGEPALVERQVGRGYILMTPVALDHRDSNLPTLKCFVPLVHELVYFLAAPLTPELNLRAGSELTLELGADTAGLKVRTAAFADCVAGQGPPLEVETPSGQRRGVRVARSGEHLIVRFAETQEPGLYRLRFPAALATAAGTNAAAAADWPFTVLNPPEEASLAQLSDADELVLRQRLGLFAARRPEDVLAAVGGEIPGQEIWKYLAIGLLLALLGETALARWIAAHRRFHTAQTVAFGAAAETPSALRQRMGIGRRTSQPEGQP